MTKLFDSLFENAGANAGRHSMIVPEKYKENFAAVGELLSGNVEALVNRALDALIGKYLPPNDRRLVGGISLYDAREQFKAFMKTDWEKANLWHLSIEDLVPTVNSYNNINFFANSVSYSPITITGEAIAIGSGSYDKVTNSERVEMQITSKDDTNGTIKKWLKERAAILAQPDGTFGLPVDYLQRVSVLHAYVSEDSDGASSGGIIRADVDTYIMRLGNIQYSKDRRTDELAEIQFSMVQFDTFTSIK
jgi:hypothetical protein